MSNWEKRDKTDVNYLYFVSLIQQVSVDKNLRGGSLRVLDYGCGRGIIVELLREAGFEAYGAEVCYEGADFSGFYANPLYKAGYLKEFPPNEALPFPDGFFDVIISNQVFEHIEDKRTALKHLQRILADDGVMQHHFPSKEVMKEGHIGIPMAH